MWVGHILSAAGINAARPTPLSNSLANDLQPSSEDVHGPQLLEHDHTHTHSGAECTRLPIPEGCLISEYANGQSGDQLPPSEAVD